MPSKSKEEQSANFRQRILGSKVFIVLGVIMVALIALGAFRSGVRKYQINREVDEMEQDIASLEKENERLTNFLDYLNTSDFLEKQAKGELGLKSPGESVVAVPDINVSTGTVQQDEERDAIPTDLSNPSKWWTFFFSS